MDRSATYHFLLTFHINHEPISYRYRGKQRFHSKIAIFSTPVFYTPAEGVPLELCIGAGGQKTRLMWLPGWTRSWMISSAVCIQSTNVTDRQTDTGRQQRRIASRGKSQSQTPKISRNYFLPVSPWVLTHTNTHPLPLNLYIVHPIILYFRKHGYAIWPGSLSSNPNL